uniref:Chitinase n=1 Tax=Nonomuraea gerenzanensis TaxID=93944 RepID=A0A1M4DZ28_9ACTN|nr:Chitinase [Nonomuraea gerenzanensis]
MGLIMMAGTPVIAPAAARAADDGLVAAYAMEGEVRDLSGNGHDGTVRDPRWVPGLFGNALAFDREPGLDRTVVVPDAPGLRTPSAMTLTAWVRIGPEGESCTFVSRVRHGQEPSFRLGADSWQVRAGGVVHGESLGMLPDEWIHLALVYDGTTIRVHGYGLEIMSVPASGDLGDGPLVIGGGDAPCPDGAVDEVRLYRRALTVEELERDVVTAVAPDPKAPRGLAADVSSRAVRLSWEAPVDSGGITGYEIHRFDPHTLAVPSDQTRVATVNALTYPEGCVEAGAYHYRVVALDSSGTRHPSDVIPAVADKPECPPTAPVLQVEPFNGWARVHVGTAADERGVTGIQLHRSTTPDFTPTAQTLVASPAERSTHLDHVDAAGTYYYRSVAVDTASQLSEPSPSVTAAISAPPDLQQALSGWYGLDEGSGTAVHDSSGKHHDGVLRNGTWVEGKHGRALRFHYDGVVKAPSFQARGAVTISAWVKRATDGTDYGFLHHYAHGSDSALRLSAGGWFGLPSAHVDGNDANRPAGREPIPVGVWTHLAGTFDGTYCRLYVNGEPAGWTHFERDFHGPSELRIGSSMEHLGGMVVDEVRTYDQALTPQQIRSIMNAPPAA